MKTSGINAKTGCVRICRLQNLRRIKADRKIALSYDLNGKFAFAEKPAVLLPGKDLIATAANFKADGDVDGMSQFFDETIVPQYLDQLRTGAGRALLNELYKDVKTGKTIAIGCYCADEAVCVRSVLAGLFQGVGLEVKGVDGNYAGYFDMFKTPEPVLATA